jgi:hypothetical protein
VLGNFCTVSRVKQLPGIPNTSTTDDPLLEGLVKAVSQAIRALCKQDFDAQQYNELYAGTGNTNMVLYNRPVTAVASVALGYYGTPSGTTTLAQGTDYVFTPTGITLLGGNLLPRGPATVQVVYTAGYFNYPEDLVDACARTVALRYKQALRLGQKSKSMGGETVTFDTDAWPSDVMATLENYKRRFGQRAPATMAAPVPAVSV